MQLSDPQGAAVSAVSPSEGGKAEGLVQGHVADRRIGDPDPGQSKATAPTALAVAPPVPSTSKITRSSKNRAKEGD